MLPLSAKRYQKSTNKYEIYENINFFCKPIFDSLDFVYRTVLILWTEVTCHGLTGHPVINLSFF